MKKLGWLLAPVFSCFSLAQQPQTNAIILIRHEAVSRAISPEAYNHDLWVRWPISSNRNGFRNKSGSRSSVGVGVSLSESAG